MIDTIKYNFFLETNIGLIVGVTVAGVVLVILVVALVVIYKKFSDRY